MNKEIKETNNRIKIAELYTNSQNLSYSLIKGQITRLQAKIIKQQEFETPLGNSEIAIIGASHYLRIGNIFTELLTCLPENIPTERMWLYKHHFSSFQKSVEIAKLTYKIKIWKQKFQTHTEFINTEKRISSQNQNLFYAFSGKSAITALKMKQKENKLALNTVHTYPETRTIIYSETKLIFK